MKKEQRGDCFSFLNCCDCGGVECGCRECFSCNACQSCLSDNSSLCERLAESVIVQKWRQPKIGNLPFSHNPDQDKPFPNRFLANEYIRTADSGTGGDERFRYQIVSAQ